MKSNNFTQTLKELTGFDFFAALDDTSEAEAEKGYKLSFWKL